MATAKTQTVPVRRMWVDRGRSLANLRSHPRQRARNGSARLQALTGAGRDARADDLRLAWDAEGDEALHERRCFGPH